ncbi:MotE family protein [Ammoniphilus resinae]|uniref:Flagellar motility protein MotE (MotC chaperone) n=1 Tax=Ammoniphilus resinae TaxID=861532 RepID=A0ABS4GKJ6_9BACL|nr:hypothetical protein [Ammoniphilus resinae]MBP1930791.1 flagellar motility protein MotE (MotC chaperone) [Ammoniphilus resinae]
MENTEEKYHTRLEWFFYMILLPLLFTAILTGILLQFLGYDLKGKLFEWGNTIPYVEKAIPGDPPPSEIKQVEQSSGTAKAEETSKQLQEMKQKLQEEMNKQASLKEEVAEKDQKIKELQQQVAQLQQKTTEQQTEQKQKAQRETSGVYASMSAGKAAPIIAEMPLEQAASLMKGMKQDQRGEILAKMEPDLAAKITSELLKTP